MLKFDPSSNQHYWKPNSEKQEAFVSLPDTIFEGFYGGAAGGGKSEVLLMLPIARGWHLNPRFHAIIFRRTFPQLEASLIPRSMDYKFFGGEYNATKHLWTFPSGALIRFGYIEQDKNAREHDTAEYNLIEFDELTHFTEFQYRYLMSRCRSSVVGLPAIMRSASNPGNVGHSWVRRRFVEPAKLGETLIVDKETRQSRIFIPAKLTDNPDLLENSPNYANQLALLPHADKMAKLHGDWWAFSGQKFPEFRPMQYPGEPDNAVHVIPPFEIPSWWPKLIALDWGYAAKTWVGWGAVSPDGRLYVYREYVCTKKPISMWAADVKRLSQHDGNIVSVVIDPSAKQNRGQADALTIKEEFIKHSGFDFVQDADNERVGGILLIHELLRFEPRPPRKIPPGGYSQETANRIMRMHGTKALSEYIKMFDEDPPETNLPKLQIFSNCTDLIQTIPTCVANEKRPEDIAEFKGDDPIDGFRYLAKAWEFFIEDAKREESRRTGLASTMSNFERTGDYAQLRHDVDRLGKVSEKVIPFRAIRHGRRAG